jgi:GxxExxY protein
MATQELTHKIIGMAMEIHRALGPGYLESVYHRCLEIELAAAGLDFESEVPINVFYKNKLVGKFEADLIVKGGESLLIEIKAVEALVKAHDVQAVNYLTATNIDDGLLLNFGAASLQYKHKYRLYRPPAPKDTGPISLH